LIGGLAAPMALLRNFVTVGAGTAFSRLLGFLRDIMMAAALGTGPVADAFFVAFRFPNLFRRLFAEGAFNAAFVPLFGRALEEGGVDAARRFGNEALSALLTVLLILIAVGEITMPVLMYALAPGFAEEPDKFDLAVVLTRIAFPYLALVSLMALFSGALNARGRFAAAAFAPALLNIAFIVALLLALSMGFAETESAGIILAWATLVGGVLQLVVVIWAARRAGINLGILRPRLTPGVRKLVRLFVPGALAGGITQINIVVGTIIASLAPGAVSYLYYAERIYGLPVGIVGVAIGIVLLPDLTRQLRGGYPEQAVHSQNRSLEFGMALTLPAAVALIVLAEPIISVLFERGAFTAEDSAASAAALTAFAFGLPGFLLVKVLQPAFFAREDTKTPMWFAGVSVVVNVALSLALFPSLEHVGIAIATAVASWVDAALLAVTLWRRRQFAIDAAARRRVPLLLLAALLMGAALYFGHELVSGWLDDPSMAVRAVGLGVIVVGGVILYGAFVQLTGAVDFRQLLRRWRGV
jgi:putative peptidoglycan lipid II flippase